MKRYVLVGAGGRGTYSYAKPIVDELSDCAELCGIYDINPKRAAVCSKKTGKDIPVFDDFDKMLNEVKPDGVIVTSKDCTHDEYIIKALDFGCDVVTEKPMTTDGDKCRAIWDAMQRTGKNVTVTFNCRFFPYFVHIKEKIQEGILGEIYSIHYEWMLDTVHGADYFRRWHRERKNSGSLLIHKSTHHFDIMNWLIGQNPVKVNCFGTRRFYGNTDMKKGERCLTCKERCPYYFDIKASELDRSLYYECEDADGYFRDKCIFSEEIDIEDTISLNVKYDGGAVMTYSLNAHSPYEGSRIIINGEKGRLIAEDIGGAIGPFYGKNRSRFIKFYNRQEDEVVFNMSDRIFDKPGGHGGSDPLMRANIFRGFTSDPLGQMADFKAGAMSIGIGIAANISMKEDRAVYLDEFLDFLK
ncbi:MAG: Gfo/Idh/MocA family oxidoreductase [Clostridia bacterium]|nr:Gfo/Idh/MocA family oxidoreductase [Clostridia bacterium]